jgi:F-type H+-transporting ATPase subunit b
MHIFRIIATGIVIILMAHDAVASSGGHFSLTNEIFKGINFIIFLAILYFLLFKKAKEFFKTRSTGVRSAIEDADAARKSAEEKLEEISDKLETVEQEISSLKSQAKEDGERIQAKIQKEAEELAARVVKQAKKNIEMETKKARARLQQEATLLAIEIAGELIQKNIKPEDQNRLIDEHIEKMEKLS